jgi:hypothetical protein
MSIIEDIQKSSNIKINIYSTTELQNYPGENMWVLYITTKEKDGWWTTKVWDFSKDYKYIIRTLGFWLQGVR